MDLVVQIPIQQRLMLPQILHHLAAAVVSPPVGLVQNPGTPKPILVFTSLTMLVVVTSTGIWTTATSVVLWTPEAVSVGLMMIKKPAPHPLVSPTVRSLFTAWVETLAQPG